MGKLIVDRKPDGPLVEVAPNVARDHRKVGLIAHPEVGRGWVELTPGEARLVGEALIDAANATGRSAVPSGGRS